MAEEKTAEKPATKSWLKVIGTSIFGLVSGAVLMYLSPLVNNVVRPDKPLANFAQQAEGLTVTFHNRSTDATQGWWDFGDGSSLEPYAADQESVIHTYPRPGVYTAKLSLRNFLGDENERSIPVILNASDLTPPVIEQFQTVALKPNPSAPATFRVVGQIKNAELTIWSAGDERPIEVNHDPVAVHDRLVTFNDPGKYTVRLVAVNGKQTVEKSADIEVGVGNGSRAHVILNVTYDAMCVAHKEDTQHREIKFPADHAQNTYAFTKEIPALPRYKISEARLLNPATNPAVKNVKLELSANGSKAVLTGELVKETGLFHRNSPLPSWVAQVFLAQDYQATQETKTNDPVVVDLNLPTGTEKATTLVPMPALPSKWLVKGRHVALEVRDGRQAVWKDAQVPASATMQMRNKMWNVSVNEDAGRLRLDVQESKQLSVPSAN